MTTSNKNLAIRHLELWGVKGLMQTEKDCLIA